MIEQRELTEKVAELTKYVEELEKALEGRKRQVQAARKQIAHDRAFKDKIHLLVILSIILSVSLITANLSALKIWKAGQIPVDGGILIFPVTYIVGDLLVEFFGQKVSDFVAGLIAFLGVMMCGVLKVVDYLLPDFPGADNSAFLVVESAMGQIFLASMISFFVGQIVNNYVFELLRRKYADERDFLIRALISSAPAHFVDALIFEIAAFFGKLSAEDFVKQILFALIAGLVLEGIFAPLTRFLALRLGGKPKDSIEETKKRGSWFGGWKKTKKSRSK